LLLNADLHGTIENPGWYFKDNNPERNEALDLLMLTHGWRRFRWEKILALGFKWPSFEEDKGITITGRITRDLFGIPIRNAKVYLTILNAYNDYFETRTDRKGRFRFDNLDYPDTMSVVVEARKPNGRKNLVIIIDENEFRPAETLTADARVQNVLSKGDKWKYKNVKRIDYSYNPEKQKILERSRDFKIHGEADNVIYMDDIPEGYTDMLQVLQGRVPGVLVQGNTVTIRGPGSLLLSNDPLFLIDGVPVDINAFRSLNPKDVELIEIIKGPNASIYGSRGANGVIAAYTKRGDFMKRGYLDFKMLGYATPREFYSPDYSTRASEGINDLRKTLFWKPNIILDSLGKSTVRFYTSDISGTFVMTVEGLTQEGKPVSTSAFFHVGR
jgi:TonB-dependent SusC/RagA subfamily outer membrane receptor